MADASSKPRIIEFNGLPGTGKTTLARLVGDLMKNEPDVYGPIYYSYYRYKFQKNRYSMLLSPGYYVLIYKLWKYSRLFKTPRRLDYCLHALKFVRMFRQFLKDVPNGILIIDQGVIQGLISIGHDELFPSEVGIVDIISNCNIEKMPILIVNCSCDYTDNIERLLNRHNQNSRVQKYSLEDMKNLLILQTCNFNTLRQLLTDNYPSLVELDINTNISTDENVKKIIDYMN